MAVPESQRADNLYNKIVKARDLAVHTIKITQNERYFPLEYRTALTNDIISKAKDIFVHAFTANEIKVDDNPEEWKERRRLQVTAVRECNELMALISIAKKTYHLRGKKVRHWIKLTKAARADLATWKTSDRKRYRHLEQ